MRNSCVKIFLNAECRMPNAFLAFCFSFLLSFPSHAAVFNPETFTLSNGLQIVIVQNRLSPAVVQMVWYKVGSVDEPEGKSGLAHYLEHLMFRGTEQVPPGEFNRIIAAQGGSSNAFTSHDFTAYHEAIAADRLAMVMQLEADRMQNLRITQETALPERDVVLSEREERTGNNPQGIFQERLRKALYPNHPYGIPVIGWRPEIEKITVDDVKEFYRHFYAPNNAVVIISGNVETNDVLGLAVATFGRVPLREVPAKRPFPALKTPSESRLVMKDARVQQPLIAIHTLAPSIMTQKRNEAYALEVLSEALCGGEVGVLYRDLVIKQPLASSVDCSYASSSRGPSDFIIAATPNPGFPIDDLEKALNQKLQQLSQKGLNAKTVMEAKKRLRRSAIFARDSLTAPGHIFGAALTTGETIADVENWPESIKAVTPADVNSGLRTLIASKFRITGLLLPEPKNQAVDAP